MFSQKQAITFIIFLFEKAEIFLETIAQYRNKRYLYLFNFIGLQKIFSW